MPYIGVSLVFRKKKILMPLIEGISLEKNAELKQTQFITIPVWGEETTINALLIV